MWINQLLVTIRLIIICCLFISSNLYATDTLTRDFLAQQKAIRILLDDASGYGLQAAGAELTKKLRERGFQGKFEVIYSTRVSEKIKTLFDLPDHLPPIYNDVKRNIQFMTMKEFVKRHKEKTNKKILLGMAAGLDNRPSGIAYTNGIDVVHDIPIIEYKNFANFMDVRIFAQLTTFYKYPNYIYVENNPDFASYKQKKSENKFVTTHVLSLNDIKKYFAKNNSMSAFIEGMEKQAYNVLPVYGITLKEDCKNENLASGCFPGNMLQIIAAARYAQLHGPQSFHKPLVITVFYNYEKEANVLLNIIKSKAPTILNVHRHLCGLGLTDHFFIANSASLDTKTLLSQLKKDDILLLWLGPLPKPIFDGLYNHTATNMWTPIREGNNSFSTLILTGRPHFRCGRNWELGYETMLDPVLRKKFAMLYNDSGFCRGMTSWEKNENLYQELGKLMIEAKDPRSALSQYFVDMKKMVSDPKNDRINFILDEVARLAKPSS